MSNYPDGYYPDDEPTFNEDGETSVRYTLPIDVDIDEIQYDNQTWRNIIKDVEGPYGLTIVEQDTLIDAIESYIFDENDIIDLMPGEYNITVDIRIPYSIFDVEFGRYEGDWNIDGASIDADLDISIEEIVPLD